MQDNGTVISTSENFAAAVLLAGLSGAPGTLNLYDTEGTPQVMAFSAPATWGVPVSGQAVGCTTGSGAGACPLGFVSVGATTNQNIRSVVADFGDFTSTATALSASAQACVVVPFAGTINKAQLIATPSGSVTVDVRTVAFASYTGPSSASTITASDTPALSSAVSYTDSTLTGWTTSVSANTVFCFYLTSPTSVTGVQARLSVAAN